MKNIYHKLREKKIKSILSTPQRRSKQANLSADHFLTKGQCIKVAN